MNRPVKTPLDSWAKAKIGLAELTPLTSHTLADYQLAKLRETLAHASEHSPFYRRLLPDSCHGHFTSLADLADVPFTTDEDLRRDPLSFLCGSQSAVARVVTLRTSGTSASPKRLFFSEADLDLTVDFFHHGMATLVAPGQRVLILMPGELQGSVGDLLVRGLVRMEASGIVHGPVQDPSDTISAIIDEGIQSLVGIPTQVLSLARHPRTRAIPAGQIKSVLLSTDYVPRAIVAELRRVWGSAVFQHYGMTEMGLGGGVECAALSGYHLREADLLFEIIDPHTGRPVPDGQTGEVVFTTLTRRAMPLIRYRTGDLSAFIPGVCPCGSLLRRMDRVTGRRRGGVGLGPGLELRLADLDEALFAVPYMVNYQVEVMDDPRGKHLRFTVYGGGPRTLVPPGQVTRAALEVPVIREAVSRGLLDIEPIRQSTRDWHTAGVIKRKIILG